MKENYVFEEINEGLKVGKSHEFVKILTRVDVGGW